MKKLNPNLMVKDVKETIAYCKEHFGFEVIMSVSEGVEAAKDPNLFFLPIDPEKTYLYALMKKGAVEIMFQEEMSFKKDVPVLAESALGASCTFYIEVEDVEELYARIRNKAEVVKELFTTWYGMKEFYIRDNNGYFITFAQATPEQ